MSSLKIQLFTWGTPNGRKISIALEEMNIPYDVHEINLGKGEQFDESFLVTSPANKIPAIIDPEGNDGKSLPIFESGAILIHLAQKTGQFWSTVPSRQSVILQWLMWQVGNFGPSLGQLHHFRKFAKTKVPYAIGRFDGIADQVYKVLDRRLATVEYVAEDYSIADMSIYPWAARFEWQSIDLATYPNVKRWFDELSERPAVRRGMSVPFLN